MGGDPLRIYAAVLHLPIYETAAALSRTRRNHLRYQAYGPIGLDLKLLKRALK